jgi:single-strand DNA-binding protein
MSLNKAMLIGNLTRDPEIRTTNTGQNVASFSVATNRVWTDGAGQKQNKAEFHRIIAWGRLAEICGQLLHKGTKVYVEGRLQTREWVAQDGNKRYQTEVVADTMQVLDRLTTGASVRPSDNDMAVEQLDEIQLGSDDEEIKIEDIPF